MSEWVAHLTPEAICSFQRRHALTSEEAESIVAERNKFVKQDSVKFLVFLVNGF